MNFNNRGYKQMNIELFFNNVSLKDAIFIVDSCEWEGLKIVIAGYNSEDLTVALQVTTHDSFLGVQHLFKRLHHYCKDKPKTDEGS
ncbi:hypothetical protein [Nostoc phage N1]|nr:hypothetical protein [Nostoc phage N1]